MRSLIVFIQRIVWYCGVFVLHLVIVNVAPFPLNRLDIIFIAAWWYTCFRGSSRGWWIAVILGFTRDLFSATPFGVATVALFLALYAGQWLSRTVFTSHAWHIVALTSLLNLTMYHTIFLVILAVHHSIENVPWNSITSGFLLVTGLGMATTVAGVMIVYTYHRFTDKKSGHYFVPG